MGTRSRIAIRNADDTYTSIYCHWDGYPEHVGITLRDHYPTADKVAALMALGNLSMLAADIGTQHSFEARGDGVCTAYGRDRGEPGNEAVSSPDLESLKALTQESGGEWLYVYSGHGWQCAPGGMSMFGMPASKAPGDLESVGYWLQNSTDG